MAARDMKVSVLVQLVDRLTAPLRGITAGLTNIGSRIGDIGRRIGLVGGALAALSFSQPIQQAEALHAAFRKAGAGTFIHPWRGPIDCVLLKPARISFASDELRVARIDAVFDPTGEENALGGLLGGFLGGLVGGLFSGLSGIIGAVSGVIGAAIGLVTGVLALAPLAFAVFSFGVSTVGAVIGIARAIVGTVAQAATLLPIADDLRRSFQRAAGLPIRSEAVASLAQLLTSAPAQLGAVFRPSPESGVGLASEAPAVTALPPDPRQGATLMLTIAAVLGAQGSGSSPSAAALPPGAPPVPSLEALAALEDWHQPITATERLVYLAGEVCFLTEAVSLAIEIPFESRQDAQGWQARLDGAVAAAGSRATLLAEDAPAAVSALWRALETLRGALSIDMSEVIGRLPAVVRIEPPRASAWLLAQHIAGDDPRQVVAMLQDIASRNRLHHPAMLGDGPIEVLK